MMLGEEGLEGRQVLGTLCMELVLSQKAPESSSASSVHRKDLEIIMYETHTCIWLENTESVVTLAVDFPCSRQVGKFAIQSTELF